MLRVKSIFLSAGPDALLHGHLSPSCVAIHLGVVISGSPQTGRTAAEEASERPEQPPYDSEGSLRPYQLWTCMASDGNAVSWAAPAALAMVLIWRSQPSLRRTKALTGST